VCSFYKTKNEIISLFHDQDQMDEFDEIIKELVSILYYCDEIRIIDKEPGEDFVFQPHRSQGHLMVYRGGIYTSSHFISKVIFKQPISPITANQLIKCAKNEFKRRYTVTVSEVVETFFDIFRYKKLHEE